MAGVVKIEAGGQSRPFRFKYRAIKSLAAELGVEDLEGLPARLQKADFQMLEALLYHGFKAGAEYEKEPINFSRDEIEDWLEEDVTFFKPALKEAQQQLMAALTGPNAPSPAKKKARGK